MTPRDGIKATGERPGEQAGSTCPGAMQRSAAAATGTGFEMRGWRPWRRPGPLSPARPCPSLPAPAKWIPRTPRSIFKMNTEKHSKYPSPLLQLIQLTVMATSPLPPRACNACA